MSENVRDRVFPTACSCDRYGVMHVQTAECNLNYNGPLKPQAQSIYGPDPITEAINNLHQRVTRLEEAQKTQTKPDTQKIS